MIGALEQLGLTVEPFIVGNQMPPNWTSSGSQRAFAGSFGRRIAADVVRIALGWLNARRALLSLGAKVDIVYERFGAFQALGAAFRRSGTPWILETNGLLFYEARVERKSLALSSIARRMERRAYRDCDLLVCISDELKRIIVEDCRVPSSKVLVIPNAVDTLFFDPSLYTPTRVFQEFTMVFVGNFYPWAGLDLLLDAVADLRVAGLKIGLVLVGDGPARERWTAKARQVGVDEHVVFTGRLPREVVPAYILGSDIGYSGQVALQMGAMYHSPLKIYEYMAMAKPVLASAFADAQRVILDGTNGFLFEPGKIESLKAAIRRAYFARAELSAMGQAARANVVAEHSWTTRASALLEAVDRMFSSAGLGWGEP